MSFEVELKAHVKEEELQSVQNALMSQYSAKGTLVDKYDVYWSHTPDGDPLLRTRRENSTDDGHIVLFTAKPNKFKTENGTERNMEFEFSSTDDQWENIQTFFKGIGLKECRIKWKKGYSYHIKENGFDIHAELLNVKYLGWFLEMEICPSSMDDFDVNAADKALRQVLLNVGLKESDVESRGYNRMLKELGHEKG